MSASDTAKEFVRIATTHGLAKDVIDLLEKKAGLLAEQVGTLEQENTTLLRENRKLALENQNLTGQLQSVRPKGDRLDDVTEKVLKYAFDKGDDFSDNEISQRFQLQFSVAGYHTDILLKKRFIQQTRIGMGNWIDGRSAPPMFCITHEGRKYVVENKLAG
jgi:regulator of replication initiation timing